MSLNLILIIFSFGFSTQLVNACPRNLTRQKWITELFLEARNNFILDKQVDPQCRNDFKLYMSHLANQTVWAVRSKLTFFVPTNSNFEKKFVRFHFSFILVLESSDWPTLGLLSGITTHLGNWAECLEANGSGVSGQYCLVQAKFNYKLPEEEDYCDELTSDNMKLNDASAWQVMQKVKTQLFCICLTGTMKNNFYSPYTSFYLQFEKNPVYLSRLKLSWALCVPSSCSLQDISKSLEALLVPLFHKNGLNITINVQPNLCSISSEFAYSLEFYHMT